MDSLGYRPEKTCSNCMKSLGCEKYGVPCEEHQTLMQKKSSINFTAEAWEKFSTEWDAITKQIRGLIEKRRKKYCRRSGQG